MTLLFLLAGFVLASAITVLVLYVLAEIVDLWGMPLIERPAPRTVDDELARADWRWPA